jgi:quercetin dioxygenase-like cupin family protein
MDRTTFEAELTRDGYEIVSRSMAPHQLNADHTHGFDARVLVVEGEMTITRDGAAHAYQPGEHFSMPSGCVHAEQAGAAGVTYIAGRRTPR